MLEVRSVNIEIVRKDLKWNFMDITIIIPNYNGKPYLKTCLESVRMQSHIQEVILVDNGSTDGSAEFIQKNYPDIKLIQNETNLGFAAAVNQGIRASQTGYIFLLNSDVELEHNCTTPLRECIKRDDKIFAVSARMVQYQDRGKMDDAGDEYTIIGWTKRGGYGKPLENYDQPREVFSACGGAALYKRRILEDIGLFDEQFFAYLEDVDLSYRARIHGYTCWYCPGAVVYHVGSATSGGRYNQFKVPISARNNVYLPYKNMPWPQLLVNLIFLLAGFFIKYLFFLRQGYGKLYLQGLEEGWHSLNEIDKVEFERKNWKNYFKIEWLLIKNTLLYFF